MAIHSVGGGIGGWDLDNEWVTPQVRALNLGHHETWDGQSSLPVWQGDRGETKGFYALFVVQNICDAHVLTGLRGR